MSDGTAVGTGGGFTALVASARPYLVNLLGKGLGFFVVALSCVGSFTTIMLVKPNVEPVALGSGLGLTIAAYYAGGGWKAHAEAKGNGNGKPVA